jgi:hypothetical protein
MLLLILPGTAQAYNSQTFDDSQDMGPRFPLDIKSSTGQYLSVSRGSHSIQMLSFIVEA